MSYLSTFGKKHRANPYLDRILKDEDWRGRKLVAGMRSCKISVKKISTQKYVLR